MVSVLQRSLLELGETACLVQGSPLCPLNIIWTTVWILRSCFKETVLQLQGALPLSKATAPTPDLPHSQSFQTNFISLGRPLQERQALKILHDPVHFSSKSEWGTCLSNIAECDWLNSWPMIGLHVRLCDWLTWKLCCDWCKLQSYICMAQPPPGYIIWLFRLLLRSPRRYFTMLPLRTGTLGQISSWMVFLAYLWSLPWIEWAGLVTQAAEVVTGSGKDWGIRSKDAVTLLNKKASRAGPYKSGWWLTTNIH